MKNVLIFSLLLATLQLHGQMVAVTDSIEKAQFYYIEGLKFKNGDGVEVDHMKAFEAFRKSSEFGYSQSLYALGYMHYKGFGCKQDYKRSAEYFVRGAQAGRDNSMYFYSLCLRNGYGVQQNADSARYWLGRAAELGYQQAISEIALEAENSNESAKELVRKIRNAALPTKMEINQFVKLKPNIADLNFAGDYKGYIIQYDWSGLNVVSSKRLTVNFAAKGNELSGLWHEENAETASMEASILGDSIIFRKTFYKRKDHYSGDSLITYSFKTASLNLVSKADSVYLAGNLEMFSPERNEPSKPIFVVLARDGLPIGIPALQTAIIRAYPNPFKDVVHVEFELLSSSQVELQMLNLAGYVVQRLPVRVLEAGHYSIPVQAANLVGNLYFVKLICNGKSEVKKVLRQ